MFVLQTSKEKQLTDAIDQLIEKHGDHFPEIKADLLELKAQAELAKKRGQCLERQKILLRLAVLVKYAIAIWEQWPPDS